MGMRYKNVSGKMKSISTCDLRAVCYSNDQEVICRFPEFKVDIFDGKILCEQIRANADSTLLKYCRWCDYDLPHFKCPLPFCARSHTRRPHPALAQEEKAFTVGHCLSGKFLSCTHFNMSPKGTIHFSFDQFGLGKIYEIIPRGFDRGDPYFFNDMIYNETSFPFFVECDGKPSEKTDDAFVEEVHRAVRSLSDDGRISGRTDCFTFNAGNSVKRSLHIRFPFIEVQRHEAHFLTGLLKSEIRVDEVSRSIDENPTSGSHAKLRMPLCDKTDMSTRTAVRRVLKPHTCASLSTRNTSSFVQLLQQCSLHASGKHLQKKFCTCGLSCKGGAFLTTLKARMKDGEVSIVSDEGDSDDFANRVNFAQQASSSF
tara:strand:- start:1091 stop:2200 length:1110 start_codon:yes stop_codon:yes gene_type:complete